MPRLFNLTRSLLASLVLCLVFDSACLIAKPPDAECIGRAPIDAGVWPRLLPAGIETTVALTLPLTNCDSAITGATAEVFGPANLPLRNRVAFLRSTFEAVVEVTFTPSEPGPYFVRAVLSSGATLQQTFHVLRNRDDVFTFSGLPQGCLEIDRINDVVVCSEPQGTLVELFDGGVRHRRPSTGVTVSGGSLWSWYPDGEVTVFGTDGGQLVARATTTIDGGRPITGAVIPFSDDLLLYSTHIEPGWSYPLGQLSRLHENAGHLENTSRNGPVGAISTRPSLAFSADCLLVVASDSLDVQALTVWRSFPMGSRVNTTLHLEGREFWVNATAEGPSRLSVTGVPGPEDGTEDPGIGNKQFDGRELMASQQLILKTDSVPFALIEGRAVLFNRRAAEFQRYAFGANAIANEHFIWVQDGGVVSLQQR